KMRDRCPTPGALPHGWMLKVLSQAMRSEHAWFEWGLLTKRGRRPNNVDDQPSDQRARPIVPAHRVIRWGLRAATAGRPASLIAIVRSSSVGARRALVRARRDGAGRVDRPRAHRRGAPRSPA